MRHSITLCLSATLLLCPGLPANAQGVFGRLKQAAKDKVSQTTGATPAEPAPAQEAAPAPDRTQAQEAAPAPANAPVTIKTYQNYDFTPGDTILFADDFTATQDGEFPDQWELLKGQGAVNKQQGKETFTLTDGNYVQVSPRLKAKDYLPTQFTVEYDTFFPAGSYGNQVFFENGDNESSITIDAAETVYNNGADSYQLSGALPASIREDNYENHWHHIAFAVHNRQLKIYVDQFRVLTVPDMHTTPLSLRMGGVASQEAPIIFSGFRIASGGGMNLIGQKFTEAKIVTHGINFDIDRATLRPESMGTLNQIKRIMTDNPDLKFEIDGHTDNTGSAPHNLTLSQQRADAVKTQLVTMGIPATRLTAKGYGDTKPIADNATSTGKASNRRVEFVKTT